MEGFLVDINLIRSLAICAVLPDDKKLDKELL
jgi:hypothetical protein